MAVARKVMEEMVPEVVVVGAGISGLSCAYRIKKDARERGIRLNVTVLEAGDGTGGVIQTIRNEYGILEDGPEAFVTHKPAALNLLKELGLSDRLLACSKTASRTYIAHGQQLEPLPEGFIMFAPTRLAPLAMSPLFSLRGKFRMAMDLLLPACTEDDDESLAEFVTRRLGREALDKLAEPLIAGIYSTDPHRLSAKCAVPRLKQMEQEHRSIILGLLNARGRRAQGQGQANAFLSLDGGMQMLTDELAKQVGRQNILLDSPVKSIQHGLSRRWRILYGAGRHLECDAVVVAAPASAAAKMLAEVSPYVAQELSGIEYGTTAMLTLVYEREAIAHPLDGSGFVVPSSDGRKLSACSFSSIKFQNRTKQDLVLLRAFSRSASQCDSDDTFAAVVKDLEELLGINGAPLYSRTTLRKDGLPRYTVGHQDRVERIFNHLVRHPGLLLAGNSYFGVGIPDCIASAYKAADALTQFMAKEARTTTSTI